MRILILAAVLAWPAAAHAQSTFELQKACADLDAVTNQGVVVRLNGIDPTAMFKLLCREVLELKQQPPTYTPSYTCFQFHLIINENLSPDTAQVLARELLEKLPKVAEACKDRPK